MNEPCIVRGCPHTAGSAPGNGIIFVFEGKKSFLCQPCITMLMTGEVGEGDTFIHDMNRSYQSMQQDIASLNMRYVSHTNMKKAKGAEVIREGHPAFMGLVTKVLVGDVGPTITNTSYEGELNEETSDE